ncbi:MAG: SAF domain-containing protein [Chloroflexi bacterium]|nr:SAF domain-containing protein [Chloroflexota bacterium]
MRGTEYRSPTEREWFLANCVKPAAPEQPVVEKGELLLYGIGDRSWCEFYANTGDAPEEVFEWWDDVCQGVELSDDLPRYCPFSDPGVCDGMAPTIGLRATTDIPAGTRFTPAVVEMVYIPSEAYAGQAQRAWTLGALARTGIPAGEILLQIMLCAYEVGCPELPQPETSADCDELRASDKSDWTTGHWQGFAAACFSCDDESEFSIEPEEREWYERSCSSQEPAPLSEPSASSAEQDHLLASARLRSLPAHHETNRKVLAAGP